jgi:hypothetical protein
MIIPAGAAKNQKSAKSHIKRVGGLENDPDIGGDDVIFTKRYRR